VTGDFPFDWLQRQAANSPAKTKTLRAARGNFPVGLAAVRLGGSGS